MKIPVVADAVRYGDQHVVATIYDHEETGVKELLSLSLMIS